jgi:hypothetical protein
MRSHLSLGGLSGKRRFADLSEKEILALAISAEEEDSRIYSTYAAKLPPTFLAALPFSTAWQRRRTNTDAG